MPSKHFGDRNLLDPQTHPRRRFELKDALTEGGNATAYLRVYRDGDWVTTDYEFEVYDADGQFSGSGESETYHGERGRAERMPDSEKFEIYQLMCDREEKE